MGKFPQSRWDSVKNKKNSLQCNFIPLNMNERRCSRVHLAILHDSLDSFTLRATLDSDSQLEIVPSYKSRIYFSRAGICEPRGALFDCKTRSLSRSARHSFPAAWPPTKKKTNKKKWTYRRFDSYSTDDDGDGMEIAKPKSFIELLRSLCFSRRFLSSDFKSFFPPLKVVKIEFINFPSSRFFPSVVVKSKRKRERRAIKISNLYWNLFLFFIIFPFLLYVSLFLAALLGSSPLALFPPHLAFVWLSDPPSVETTTRVILLVHFVLRCKSSLSFQILWTPYSPKLELAVDGNISL